VGFWSCSLYFNLSTCKIWGILDIGKETNLNFEVWVTKKIWNYEMESGPLVSLRGQLTGQRAPTRAWWCRGGSATTRHLTSTDEPCHLPSMCSRHATLTSTQSPPQRREAPFHRHLKQACATALLCPPLPVPTLLAMASHLRAVQPGQLECHDAVHLLQQVLAGSPPTKVEQPRFLRCWLPPWGAHRRPPPSEHLQPRHHLKKDRLSP
jgi:hypothetical protein